MILDINRNKVLLSLNGRRFIFYLVPKAASRESFTVEVYIATDEWKADPVFESIFTKKYEEQQAMLDDLASLAQDFESGKVIWKTETINTNKPTEEEILEVERKTTQEAIKNLSTLENSKNYAHLIFLGEKILECDFLKSKKLDEFQKRSKASILATVGAAFIKVAELDKAKEFLTESIKIHQSADRFEKLGRINSSLGNIAQAIENLNTALALCDKELKNAQKALKMGVIDMDSKSRDVMKEEIQTLLKKLQTKGS